MPSAVALVDANNFYVSCERAFQPSLLGRAVVVLSNNDGCVISRSEEAKALGIRMGAPLFKIRHAVEAYDVAVYSSNYALYADMSQRVMEALQEFTPEVEVYSIDEAFVRLEADGGATLAESAARLGRSVRAWTGIPVSVGVAPTKTLAKVARRFAGGAQGVCDLTGRSAQEEALRETPVECVWGVGPAYSKLLRGAGLETALALRDADRRWVRERMTVAGARVVEELRGVSCLALEQCPPQKKSVTCSRTFGAAVHSLADLREAVSVYTTRAAERLRRHGLAAGVVTVFVSTDRFGAGPPYASSATCELAHPTDATGELLEWSLKALGRVFREGYAYRKAGVMLNHLVPAEGLTRRLWGAADYERARRVMRAVDKINNRHGRDTVRLGARRRGADWESRLLRRSRRYTTCLREVLRVA